MKLSARHPFSPRELEAVEAEASQEEAVVPMELGSHPFQRVQESEEEGSSQRSTRPSVSLELDPIAPTLSSPDPKESHLPSVPHPSSHRHDRNENTLSLNPSFHLLLHHHLQPSSSNPPRSRTLLNRLLHHLNDAALYTPKLPNHHHHLPLPPLQLACSIDTRLSPQPLRLARPLVTLKLPKTP